MSDKFFKRIRFKYKISILNENTFEEKVNFRLSALSMFLLVSFTVSISFLLISLLIFLTPIKLYLPGYADVSVKGDLISESMRIDSLSANLDAQSVQFEMFKLIIKDEIPLDSIVSADSLTLASWASLPLEKSAKEKSFAAEYEKDAKYNLSSIDINSSSHNAKANIFISPTNGVIVDSMVNKNHGVSIATTHNTSVLAITSGTIIHSSLSSNSGYMVMIQHDNGFVSIYNNIERLLKRNNEHVNTGEVFAFVGDTKENKKSPLTFELWLNGIPQKPTDYIVF